MRDKAQLHAGLGSERHSPPPLKSLYLRPHLVSEFFTLLTSLRRGMRSLVRLVRRFSSNSSLMDPTFVAPTAQHAQHQG